MVKKIKKAKAKKATGKKRYFGTVKIPKGAKLAWVSIQNKNGYKLGLGLGTRTVWVKGLHFASKDEVNRVLNGKVVFINLKGVK